MVRKGERERNRQPRPLVVLSVPPLHEPRERRAQGDGHVGTADHGSGLTEADTATDELTKERGKGRL